MKHFKVVEVISFKFIASSLDIFGMADFYKIPFFVEDEINVAGKIILLLPDYLFSGSKNIKKLPVLCYPLSIFQAVSYPMPGSGGRIFPGTLPQPDFLADKFDTMSINKHRNLFQTSYLFYFCGKLIGFNEND